MTKLLLPFVLVISLSFLACQGHRVSTVVETPVSNPVSMRAVLPPPSDVLPPPTQAELEAVAKRVLGSTEKINLASADALAGDFNGDGYGDLAISIKATATMVSKNQSGLANWIAVDPAQVYIPQLNKNVQRLPNAPAKVTFRTGEPLILILHGYGPSGWRSPQAQQVYLLTRLQVLNTELPIATFPALANDPRLPHQSRQVLCGPQQCLVWDGAYYVAFPRANGAMTR